MSPLLTACKTLVFCGLGAALFSAATAQDFTPTGGESPVSGTLLGDQVFPAASLGPGGGYAVWQDSKIDGKGKGQGVMARKLSATFQPAGEPFSITQKKVGHQESPSVAMLSGGGAAFSWLGPNHSSPDVFTRFVNAEGAFVTGDIQVNPLASRLLRTNRTVQMTGFKANKLRNLTFRVPDSSRVFRDHNQSATVTALPDGGAVVTYAGARRLHTNWTQIVTVVKELRGRSYTNDLPQKFSASQDWMLDVFFQRFSADGKKVGDEVLVNQFVKYNQRQPSVAVLPNGAFVVTWVSESYVDSIRRSFDFYAGSPLLLAQVDIVARLFRQDGTPLSHEFTVNSAVGSCATPTVSAMNDGRFTIAWAQRDGVRTNGWDIFARTFEPDGDPLGDAMRINNHTYGDQYAPTITSAGTQQLLAWSSLGQDKVGSATASFVQRDGSVVTLNMGRPASVPAVYGRLLLGGTAAGQEFRINSGLTGKPMQPSVASDGVNRFVAFWSGFNTTGDYDLFSQAYVTPMPAGATNNAGGVAPPPPPAGSAGFRVAVSGSAEKVRLSWAGEVGARYQVQTSTNLSTWTNVGVPRTAGAAEDTVSYPLGGAIGFYRVVKLP